MLHLTAIEKKFGNHHVFSIDELILQRGIYWLKGANGSGKSTLMNLIAGLLPFKGQIVLGQTINIRQQPSHYRSRVNHAAAEPIYPSFLTGNEIVKFVCSVKKGSVQQVDEIKKILGIDNYLSNPTGSYSSGMLKKLSLLAAFMGQPDWILLDEPFTTLDRESQSALCQLISDKHAKGVSFIITSHHDIETPVIRFTNVFTLKEKKLSEAIP